MAESKWRLKRRWRYVYHERTSEGKRTASTLLGKGILALRCQRKHLTHTDIHKRHILCLLSQQRRPCTSSRHAGAQSMEPTRCTLHLWKSVEYFLIPLPLLSCVVLRYPRGMGRGVCSGPYRWEGRRTIPVSRLHQKGPDGHDGGKRRTNGTTEREGHERP